MARIDELPFTYRGFLRAYRWRRIDPVPWAPLGKPLAEARLALVSSAGMTLPGQEPFDPDERGGDPTFRVVPGDTRVGDLSENHRSKLFDHAGVREDPNLAFPLDRVRELAERGRIGSVAPRHLSCMGSLTAPGRMLRDEAPRAAEIFASDQVDVALLVPV